MCINIMHSHSPLPRCIQSQHELISKQFSSFYLTLRALFPVKVPKVMADTSLAENSDMPSAQRATLNYIQWKEDFMTVKPYEVISEVPDGCQRRNFSLGPGPEQTIHDIRGREDQFNLDNNGFEVRKHELLTTSFDTKSIQDHYLPAIESLLESVDPGAEVCIFDWRVSIRYFCIVGSGI